MKKTLLAGLLSLALPITLHAYEPKATIAAPAAHHMQAASNLPHADWWKTPYPTPFDAKQLKRKQQEIRVEGNKFVDEKGKTFIFRGVNISDPDKLVQQGKWSKSHFAAAKDFGANVIRLPIHPVAWQGRGTDAYLELIDQAVLWANELDMYLIVDWHSMGNITKELFFHPMYATTAKETREFWRTIAWRYSGIATIAIYELFNEPTINGGRLGSVDWREWKAFNEDLIDIIHAHDKDIISVVAGFNWAYDLSEVANHPIERDGVAYAIHPYPQKEKTGELTTMWDAHWGYLADKYPLIASEIGWMRENEPGAHVPVINDGSYGPIIRDYMAKKGMSFTIWCFDPDWPPQMISDWNYTPTEQGAFFKKVMLDARKQ